jgi:hypothetical protein
MSSGASLGGGFDFLPTQNAGVPFQTKQKFSTQDHVVICSFGPIFLAVVKGTIHEILLHAMIPWSPVSIAPRKAIPIHFSMDLLLFLHHLTSYIDFAGELI